MCKNASPSLYGFVAERNTRTVVISEIGKLTYDSGEADLPEGTFVELNIHLTATGLIFKTGIADKKRIPDTCLSDIGSISFQNAVSMPTIFILLFEKVSKTRVKILYQLCCRIAKNTFA
ncbi:MAG: hypothetical protein IPN33_22735 [Saprospiraceae bacterium]|nr:hypothetical protein [Saprospiraceae bacterium]